MNMDTVTATISSLRDALHRWCCGSFIAQKSAKRKVTSLHGLVPLLNSCLDLTAFISVALTLRPGHVSAARCSPPPAATQSWLVNQGRGSFPSWASLCTFARFWKVPTKRQQQLWEWRTPKLASILLTFLLLILQCLKQRLWWSTHRAAASFLYLVLEG